ncbi:PspA/IM30 family protein [candidate division KSB1 bacterium]|nr:MAG: PspA/IM30 family protein [candidate division KSB1 bacterium]MBC6949600.1 PspA/IM30 family protein [candidate division KSB1 bacterium]MCE7943566.1 PspA/IM30 family protein [Chlorobi bacterium CHB1]
MPSVFQRIFKIAQSEAHSAVDKLEDPIKISEQGIRDLKNDLQASMTSLAQVKALAIRMKKDAEDQQRISNDYERKAMLLLQKGQGGELDAAQADKLATEALTKKEEAAQRATSLMTDHQAQQNMADQLQVKVERLKQTITRYENELVTLKARARTASSMRKINQQLANVDSSSTLQMLERMKDKVKEEETLAEAYGEVAAGSTSLDEQIDKALATPAAGKAADSLAELKKKMGITAG